MPSPPTSGYSASASAPSWPSTSSSISLGQGGRFARAENGLSIALYFLWKIPEIVNQILPLAVLMTTLMTLGGMSRTSEITAMRSCGISIARISAPLLGLAAVVSILALAGGEFLVPYSVNKTQYIQMC